MHLEDIRKHFERRARERGMSYQLAEGATAMDFAQAEDRLQVIFPAQIRLFYQHYDGLHVDEPPLEIHSLHHLSRTDSSLLHFAMVDLCHPLCFDVSHVNEAGQWDIVAVPSGYRVTLSMASFWSNKLWAWLDKGRTIWQPETHN